MDEYLRPTSVQVLERFNARLQLHLVVRGAPVPHRLMDFDDFIAAVIDGDVHDADTSPVEARIENHLCKCGSPD